MDEVQNYNHTLSTISRNLGTYQGTDKGAHIIFVVGLHGNEPAGLFAFNTVLDQLQKLNPHFKGTVQGLVGNLSALKEKKRYIDEDLNRNWNDFLAGGGDDGKSEDAERREITTTFKDILANTENEVFIFDLHTTSSESVAFVSVNDTLRNRSIIDDIPSVVILGLEEMMKGTLNSTLNDLGLTAILFEAGQHDDLSSIENHNCIYMADLKKTGLY